MNSAQIRPQADVPAPSSRLRGKVAVVTGAAGGLGAGIAHHLAVDGATVVCADLGDASAVARAISTGAAPDCATAVRLDVTDTASVEETFDRIADEHGSIDIMVNNAGVAQPIVDLLSSDDALLHHVFSVNVYGVLACSRAAARAMISAGNGGRIITTASARAKLPWPGLGAYSASKAAAVSITQSLALELAPHGITANAICPGTMWTDMSKQAFGTMAQGQGMDIEDLLRAHIEGIPAGRLGTPDDAGAIAAFLASDAASFITGACINLTGGEDAFF